MNNDRIVNLILQFEDKTDATFQKMKSKFAEFKQKFGAVFLHLNNLLQLQSKLVMELNEKVMALGLAYMGLKFVAPLLGRIAAQIPKIVKSFLAWIVLAHLFYRTFKKTFDWLLEKVKEIAKYFEDEFGPDSPISKFFGRLSSAADRMKQKNPFSVIADSLRNMAPGGPLGKVMKGLADLLENPAIAGKLLLLGSAFTAISATIGTIVGLSVSWFKITIDGLTKIIQLGVQVGSVLTTAFISSLQGAVSLHSEYEKLQKQMEATLRSTSMAGTEFADRAGGKTKSITEAAKAQIQEIKQIGKDLAHIADEEIVGAMVQTQVLGTIDKFTDALRGKVESGKEKEKLAQIAADMAANFGMSFDEAMTTMNQAAMGRFIMLQRKTGITRAAAKGASSSGDAVEGMLTLLDRQSAGAAKKVQDTFEGAMSSIRKFWLSEWRDITQGAFDNIRDLAISARDAIKDLFETDEWKAAKEVLSQIYRTFTDFARSSVIPNATKVVKNLLGVVGSKETSELMATLAARFQSVVSFAGEFAVKLSEVVAKYLPDILQMFTELTKFGLTFFYLVGNNLDRLIDGIIDFGKRGVKIWGSLGVVATGVLTVLGNMLDVLLIQPFQTFMHLFVKFGKDAKPVLAAVNELINPGSGARVIDAINFDEMERGWKDITKTIDDGRKVANEAAEGVMRFNTALSQGQGLGEAFSAAMQGMDLGEEWEKATGQAEEAISKFRKTVKDTAKELKGDEAMGAFIPYDPEHISAIIDFYNGVGQNQKALNTLNKEWGGLLEDAAQSIETTLKDINDISKSFSRLNEFTDTLIANFKMLTDWGRKFLGTLDAQNSNAEAIVGNMMKVIDFSGGILDNTTKQVFEQNKLVIEAEKWAGEIKMKMGQAEANIALMIEGQGQYNEALLKEVELRDKIREKMFSSQKTGADAILTLIEAKKGLMEVMNVDQGPLANFEAQRNLQREQLEALKFKLQLQQDNLKALVEEQKLRGGMTDQIIQTNTEIIQTKTQMKDIENTLKNIAKPTLLEQIVNAPQRILALLPSSAQMHNRVKTSIDEQKNKLQGARDQGMKIIATIDPNMTGGKLVDGMMLGKGDRMLGTKFLPTNIPGMGKEGVGVRDLIGQVQGDASKLPGMMARMTPQLTDKQKMSQLVDRYLELAPMFKKALAGVYSPNGVTPGKPNIQVPVINLGANVTVQVNDLNSQLDSVMPKIKQAIVETVRQEQRKREKGIPG